MKRDLTGFKASLWHVLNDQHDRRYVWFHHGINLLIVTSVSIVLWQELGAPPPEWRPFLERIDFVVLAIFGVEFLARLWVIRAFLPRAVRLSRREKFQYWAWSKLRFIFSPWGLIDFLALLPMFTPLFPWMRSLRILRLLRLFRSFQFFRYASPLRTLTLAFRDNSVLFLVSLGFVVQSIVVSALMFYLAEFKANPNVATFADTLWWSVVTITTVGFGDITPVTAGGKIIGAALMLSGIFTIALFAGVISSTLVGHLLPLRVEQVRMSSISDHIIIAGWSEQVPMLLGEMEREYGGEMPPVIVFSPRERPESLDPDYVFVQGDFRSERELDKVRTKFARVVLVIADEGHGEVSPAMRDASTVLTVFTVRSFERGLGAERTKPLHVVAEILDPENSQHATVAGADEVIETSRLGSSVLAHTAGNVGVASIITNLVQASKNNVYATHLPTSLREGELLTFEELQRRATEELAVLVIGVIHNDEMKLNPPPSHRVFAADKMVYIGARIL